MGVTQKCVEESAQLEANPHRFVVNVILFASFLAAALLKAPRHPCLVGLTLNITAKGGIQELTDSVMEERRLGVDMMASPFKWADLEPSPGQFKLDKLRDDLRNQANLGFAPVLTIQTIDTDKRTVPTDLALEAWNSERMLLRERALLAAVGRVLPTKLDAVMLGNEVDGYLSNHLSQVDAYARFLKSGKDTLKSIRPDLHVGVVTMFTGLAAHHGVIDRIQSGMDIVAMTYYPLGSDFSVLPVGDVKDHFRQMIDFSGTRKLYLQEVGYPASTLLNSSGTKQAAFVDAVFDELKRYGPQMYGACFFLLVDFSDQMVDALLGYYSLKAEKFKAMLGTLGLKDQFGMPRPAWATFKSRMAAF